MTATASSSEMLSPVAQLVADFAGIAATSLRPSTTLLGDLGIDGDDASELLQLFAARFAVDLSAFTFSNHFGGEGVTPLFALKWLRYALRRGTPERCAGLEPVTIESLAKAAVLGRWEPCA